MIPRYTPRKQQQHHRRALRCTPVFAAYTQTHFELKQGKKRPQDKAGGGSHLSPHAEHIKVLSTRRDAVS